MDKKYMMDCVYRQLAIDYNCLPDDFLKNGLIFTEARQNEGRRPYPWVMPRLEIISFGSGAVINASADILPLLRKQAEGKTRDDAFWAPFVYGPNLYFLPDLNRNFPIDKPDGLTYELVEEPDIHKLYSFAGFDYVLHYGDNSPFPEMLVALAKQGDTIVGMAGAHAGCNMLRSINVDVLPSYRGKGIAAALVNTLTLEILNRGYIPYYFSSESNIQSMRAAVRAGYSPAWVHSYKTRLQIESINY